MAEDGPGTVRSLRRKVMTKQFTISLRTSHHISDVRMFQTLLVGVWKSFCFLLTVLVTILCAVFYRNPIGIVLGYRAVCRGSEVKLRARLTRLESMESGVRHQHRNVRDRAETSRMSCLVDGFPR